MNWRESDGVSRKSWDSLRYVRTPLGLFVFLLVFAAWRGPALLTSSGVAGAIVSSAPLILAAMALTPTAMAGRGDVDLSIGPLIGLINVTTIQWLVNNGHTAPIKVFTCAILTGIVVHAIMGLVSAALRVEPIIVALGAYLVLAGLNLVIMPTPGGQAPTWLTSWGAGRSIISPMLALLVVAFLVWWGFTQTALFTHIRLSGSSERTAYVSGIPIGRMRVLAHVVGGVFAGFAGLAFTGLIGSGDPTQGNTYTLLAVTALVLGGTSLAGGSGGALGSVLAALDIFLISYVLSTFSLGSLSSFVNQFANGTFLVAAMLLAAFLGPRRSKKVGVME